MANEKIRTTIKETRIHMWEVATQIGIADATFSKWLRTPLNDERRERVEKAIAELTHSVKQ